MKLYLHGLFLLFSTLMIAQSNQIKNDTILVRGNCKSCKVKIENAVQEEPTAKGEWNILTKILIVSYNQEKTSLKKIMHKVAKAGYDNQLYTAKDQAYFNLAGCCQYDRITDWDNIQNSEETHIVEESSNTDHDGHNHASQNHSDHNKHDEYKEEDENTVSLAHIHVEGNKGATSLNAKSIGLTFNIDKKELTKAACCNLAESFETNATVDVNYANAVTGSKQIKMLGLDQKYTLITKELLPEIRGLATAYGMNFIPGRWVSGIQLTKGGSTVTNGYESISGQINTELYKTHKKGKTLINLFANLQTRLEGNIVHADTINKKWSHSVLAHGNATLERIDNNKDGFMDQPIGRQINTTYLLNFNDIDGSGVVTHFGINFLDDHRLAGQMNFIENNDQLTTNNYGVGIDINRFQAWNKTGYIFKNKPYQSIGLMNQFTYYEQDSYFGLTPYNGIQKTIYSNLIFESILGSSEHKYKIGASFLYDLFDEIYKTESFSRKEKVPGIFAEYTYIGKKLTAVVGTRLDFHNLAGTQFTPRFNLKYDISKKTIVRASIGRGFRTANIFAESQNYIASNRTIEIINSNGEIYGLKPEIAWNYGLSLQQKFRFLRNKSTLVIDYFRTDFENQILPDLDSSPQKILFYNMDGNAYANSLQIQWDFKPVKQIDIRLAYKNYETQASYINGNKEIPFTAKHRAFANLAYNTVKKAKGQQWNFDTTLQWIGKQRIPNTSNNPAQFQLASTSKSYFTLNAQISRQMSKQVRLYIGGENILNFRQNNPILDVKNPFSNYFDGGMIWGPISATNLYAGLDIEF